MVDNVSIDPGTTTPIATDDVSGVQFQKIKVDIGGDGATVPLDGGQEAMAASVPVVVASDQSALSVKPDNTISTNNSTTTPLAGDAVYTGTADDVSDYATVVVTLKSDVDSAADGMAFQFSTDNTNWDDVNSFTMDVSSESVRRFQFPVTAQYFRIVYTNGTGAQSAFRVQTILMRGNVLTTVHRLIDDLEPDRSVEVTKSAIFAQANGSGNFSAVDATAGGNLKMAVQEFDAAASLPAGTNAIGKLAANSGVDIGDVDVLSVVPGTGATNLGKAVDSPAGATDTGVPPLAVRDDALGGLTPAEGDYAPLAVDANGALWVKPNGTVVVDGSGVTQPVSAASLPLPTGASTAANQSTGNTSLSTLAGAVTGTEMQVDVVAALPAGTNAIGKLAANSGVDIGDVDVLTLPGVAGDVAHDGADSGNPIKAGAKAIAHSTNPTAVAAADRTDLYANRAGVLFTIGGHPNSITHRVNYTTAQTNAAIITVAGGSKIVVTRITVTLDNATTVDVQVRVGFAAATTPTAAGVIASHPGIAAGGGFTIGDGSGILGIGADGEDLRVTSEVPTTGSLDICVTYYTIES